VLWTLSNRDQAAYVDAMTLLRAKGRVPAALNFGEESAAEAIVAAGFLPILAAILTSTTEGTTIQLPAYACLSNLAACLKGNRAMCDMGILPVMCQYAHRHLTDEANLVMACETVWNFALNPSSIPALLACNWVQLVVDALSHHRDNEQIALYACLAIALIGTCGGAQGRSIAAQVPARLVSATAEKHALNSDVQTLCTIVAGVSS
jgi:hypothetical protein